jgi:FkbM family methyltransferase
MNLTKAARAACNPKHWPSLIHFVVPTIEHEAALRGINPATVIDAGANKGQFAWFASKLWPSVPIHAFEPLTGPRKKLRAVMGPRAVIHPLALGDADAELEFHLASRLDSSSLLAVGEKQSRIFGVTPTVSEIVSVRRLDSMLSASDLQAPTLLKIDVQGYEFEVLRGMGALAASIAWVYVEVSFVELYQRQRLFPDVDQLLKDLGYDLLGLHNAHRTPNGALVQADALYASRPA